MHRLIEPALADTSGSSPAAVSVSAPGALGAGGQVSSTCPALVGMLGIPLAPREQSRVERLLVGLSPRSPAAEARTYLMLVPATDVRPRQALVGIGGWRKDVEGKWHLPHTRGTVIRLTEIDELIAALQEARRVAGELGWDLPQEGPADVSSPAESNANGRTRPGPGSGAASPHGRTT